MSFYHQSAPDVRTATMLAIALEKADEESGRVPWTWRVEYHGAACGHAIGGWFAVARNEQGYMWTGAPWDMCDSCRKNQGWKDQD